MLDPFGCLSRSSLPFCPLSLVLWEANLYELSQSAPVSSGSGWVWPMGSTGHWEKRTAKVGYSFSLLRATTGCCVHDQTPQLLSDSPPHIFLLCVCVCFCLCLSEFLVPLVLGTVAVPPVTSPRMLHCPFLVFPHPGLIGPL